jgi:hypothetical protein
MGLIASGIDAQAIDRPGGIFVRLADQIANEDRILLQSVARAIISDARGTLAEQIKRPRRPPCACRRCWRTAAASMPTPARHPSGARAWCWKTASAASRRMAANT